MSPCLKCPVCKMQSFMTKKEVVKHFDDLHGDKICVHCETCKEKIYGGIKNYLLHMAAHHPNESTHPKNSVFANFDNFLDHTQYGQDFSDCFICGDNVNKNELEKHFELNHSIDHNEGKNDNFKYCSKCNIFVDFNSFKAHLIEKHRENDMKICFKCLDFVPITNFKEHMKNNHSLSKCNKCNDYYEGSILKHLKTSHPKHKTKSFLKLPKKKNLQQIKAEERSISNDLNLNKGRDYFNAFFPNRKKKFQVECPICSVLLRGYSFNNHMYDVHTHEKQLKCTLCPEVFYRKSVRLCHMKYVHNVGVTKKKSHECTFCRKRFLVPSQLDQHIKAVHEGQRNHLCDQCGESFQYLHTLKSHRLTHSKVKNWLCKICNKTFPKSSSVRKHVQTVHQINLTARFNNPLEGAFLPYCNIENGSNDIIFQEVTTCA